MANKIVCPVCGKPLVVAIRTLGHYSRKINKNGTVSKRLRKEKPISDGSEYLYCSNPECAYTYDFWNHSGYYVEEFEAWYEEHQEEITFGLED